jgi:hypothetical protein
MWSANSRPVIGHSTVRHLAHGSRPGSPSAPEYSAVATSAEVDAHSMQLLTGIGTAANAASAGSTAAVAKRDLISGGILDATGAGPHSAIGKEVPASLHRATRNPGQAVAR